MRIAVVGGGLSGTACAAQLQRELPDAAVTLFTADSFAQGAAILGGRLMSRDAARAAGNAPGGRLRIDRFDVACQGFTASDERFAEEVRRWVAEGAVVRRAARVATDGRVRDCELFHGADGMDSVLRHLRRGVDTVHALVREVRRDPGTGRHVVCAHRVDEAPAGFEGFPLFGHAALPRCPAAERAYGPFHCVVLAPGCLAPTCHRVALTPPGPIGRLLEGTAFAPVWACHMAFDEPVDCGADVLLQATGPLRAAVHQGPKWGGGARGTVWSLISAPGENRVAGPQFPGPLSRMTSIQQRAAAARVLWRALQAVVGPLPEPAWQVSFFWQYAFPAVAPADGTRSFFDADQGLALVGDWPAGTCEAAWLSGVRRHAQLVGAGGGRRGWGGGGMSPPPPPPRSSLDFVLRHQGTSPEGGGGWSGKTGFRAGPLVLCLFWQVWQVQILPATMSAVGWHDTPADG